MAELDDITPAIGSGKQLIQSYGAGRFRVAGRLYEGSVLIHPDETLIWDVGDPDALTLSDFEHLNVRNDIADIMLVGCGPDFQPPITGLRSMLKERGLVLEWMDTRAACRTFNVLLAEERRAAAAILAIG